MMLRSQQVLRAGASTKRWLAPTVSSQVSSGRHKSTAQPQVQKGATPGTTKADPAKEEQYLKELLLQQRNAIRTATEVKSVAKEILGDGIKNDLKNAAEESSESPSEFLAPGDVSMPVTSFCHLVKPEEDTPRGAWPVFRLMDENGEFRTGATDGYVPETDDWKQEYLESSSLHPVTSKETHELRDLWKKMKETFPIQANEIDKCSMLLPSEHEYADTKSDNTLKRAHRQMIRLREMDKILQNVQRQGKISFYMTCTGEEAIHIGAASALTPQDTVLAQYREAGLLMWRGFTLEQFINQCFGNVDDLGKGRQMPVHYGSRALNYQTIGSNLGAQIPQAAGAAYQMKLAGKKSVSICFFGEGCSSTVDFHSGLNFAATLGCPVIFFCRNNGYAISTPSTEQYAGDGVVSRAPGYGMAAIRVDGNDIFAVHAAVRESKKYALEHNAPVLIEAMTYRHGHHSTSDDSLRYREADEVEDFTERSDPITRMDNFLKKFHQLSDEDIKNIHDEERMAVLDAMRISERKPPPFLEDLFSDVYHELPPALHEQQQQLHAHIQKYPDKYTKTTFKDPSSIINSEASI